MLKVIQTDGKAEAEFLEQLKRRSGEVNKTVTETVTRIIEDVREKGDQAVC